MRVKLNKYRMNKRDLWVPLCLGGVMRAGGVIIMVIFAICMWDAGVPWMSGFICILTLLSLVQIPTKPKSGGQTANFYNQGGGNQQK